MHRRPRGFTIIEVVIVLAIVAVMAGLAIAGMVRLRSKAALQTMVADVVMQLEAGKRLAIANGSTVWVGFLPKSGDEPLRLVVYEDWNDNFDPATFDPADPEAQIDAEVGTGRRRDRLVRFLRLSDELRHAAGTDFGTLDHVPLAFRTVDPTAVTGCSFCDASGGWLRFLPRGEARLVGGGGTGGGLFLTGDDPDGQALPTIYFISITEPYGLVRSFKDA